MKKFIFLFASALALLADTASAKLNVVATTPDLGALAQEIGGDKIDLTVMAKPTEDPHFVDPKPSYIVKLNRADVLIEGGAELEGGWLKPLVDGARNPKIGHEKAGRIEAAEGVALLEVPATLDRSKGDVHASGNPHYLTDPVNAKIVAEHICKKFCQLDEAGCDSYRANLKKFESRLDAKLIEWGKLLAPYKGKQVVTYHNYWRYFAEQFDLKMDLFLEPKPGIPPSPAHLASVIEKMKASDINVILVQPYLNRRTAETVAKHTGAVVLDFPSFPGAKGAAPDYIGWMDALVQSLAKALEKK